MEDIQKLSLSLATLYLRIRYAQDDLEEMEKEKKRLERRLEMATLAKRGGGR